MNKEFNGQSSPALSLSEQKSRFGDGQVQTVSTGGVRSDLAGPGVGGIPTQKLGSSSSTPAMEEGNNTMAPTTNVVANRNSEKHCAKIADDANTNETKFSSLDKEFESISPLQLDINQLEEFFKAYEAQGDKGWSSEDRKKFDIAWRKYKTIKRNNPNLIYSDVDLSRAAIESRNRNDFMLQLRNSTNKSELLHQKYEEQQAQNTSYNSSPGQADKPSDAEPASSEGDNEKWYAEEGEKVEVKTSKVISKIKQPVLADLSLQPGSMSQRYSLFRLLLSEEITFSDVTTEKQLTYWIKQIESIAPRPYRPAYMIFNMEQKLLKFGSQNLFINIQKYSRDKKKVDVDVDSRIIMMLENCGQLDKPWTDGWTSAQAKFYNNLTQDKCLTETRWLIRAQDLQDRYASQRKGKQFSILPPKKFSNVLAFEKYQLIWCKQAFKRIHHELIKGAFNWTDEIVQYYKNESDLVEDTFTKQDDRFSSFERSKLGYSDKAHKEHLKAKRTRQNIEREINNYERAKDSKTRNKIAEGINRMNSGLLQHRLLSNSHALAQRVKTKDLPTPVLETARTEEKDVQKPTADNVNRYSKERLSFNERVKLEVERRKAKKRVTEENSPPDEAKKEEPKAALCDLATPVSLLFDGEPTKTKFNDREFIVGRQDPIVDTDSALFKDDDGCFTLRKYVIMVLEKTRDPERTCFHLIVTGVFPMFIDALEKGEFDETVLRGFVSMKKGFDAMSKCLYNHDSTATVEDVKNDTEFEEEEEDLGIYTAHIDDFGLLEEGTQFHWAWKDTNRRISLNEIDRPSAADFDIKDRATKALVDFINAFGFNLSDAEKKSGINPFDVNKHFKLIFTSGKEPIQAELKVVFLDVSKSVVVKASALTNSTFPTKEGPFIKPADLIKEEDNIFGCEEARVFSSNTLLSHAPLYSDGNSSYFVDALERPILPFTPYQKLETIHDVELDMSEVASYADDMGAALFPPENDDMNWSWRIPLTYNSDFASGHVTFTTIGLNGGIASRRLNMIAALFVVSFFALSGKDINHIMHMINGNQYPTFSYPMFAYDNEGNLILVMPWESRQADWSGNYFNFFTQFKTFYERAQAAFELAKLLLIYRYDCGGDTTKPMEGILWRLRDKNANGISPDDVIGETTIDTYWCQYSYINEGFLTNIEYRKGNSGKAITYEATYPFKGGYSLEALIMYMHVMRADVPIDSNRTVNVDTILGLFDFVYHVGVNGVRCVAKFYKTAKAKQGILLQYLEKAKKCAEAITKEINNAYSQSPLGIPQYSDPVQFSADVKKIMSNDPIYTRPVGILDNYFDHIYSTDQGISDSTKHYYRLERNPIFEKRNQEFTRKETIPLGSNSIHLNLQNGSAIIGNFIENVEYTRYGYSDDNPCIVKQPLFNIYHNTLETPQLIRYNYKTKALEDQIPHYRDDNYLSRKDMNKKVHAINGNILPLHIMHGFALTSRKAANKMIHTSNGNTDQQVQEIILDVKNGDPTSQLDEQVNGGKEPEKENLLTVSANMQVNEPTPIREENAVNTSNTSFDFDAMIRALNDDRIHTEADFLKALYETATINHGMDHYVDFFYSNNIRIRAYETGLILYMAESLIVDKTGAPNATNFFGYTARCAKTWYLPGEIRTPIKEAVGAIYSGVIADVLRPLIANLSFSRGAMAIEAAKSQQTSILAGVYSPPVVNMVKTLLYLFQCSGPIQAPTQGIFGDSQFIPVDNGARSSPAANIDMGYACLGGGAKNEVQLNYGVTTMIGFLKWVQNEPISTAAGNVYHDHLFIIPITQTIANDDFNFAYWIVSHLPYPFFTLEYNGRFVDNDGTLHNAGNGVPVCADWVIVRTADDYDITNAKILLVEVDNQNDQVYPVMFDTQDTAGAIRRVILNDDILFGQAATTWTQMTFGINQMDDPDYWFRIFTFYVTIYGTEQTMHQVFDITSKMIALMPNSAIHTPGGDFVITSHGIAAGTFNDAVPRTAELPQFFMTPTFLCPASHINSAQLPSINTPMHTSLYIPNYEDLMHCLVMGTLMHIQEKVATAYRHPRDVLNLLISKATSQGCAVDLYCQQNSITLLDLGYVENAAGNAMIDRTPRTVYEDMNDALKKTNLLCSVALAPYVDLPIRILEWGAQVVAGGTAFPIPLVDLLINTISRFDPICIERTLGLSLMPRQETPDYTGSQDFTLDAAGGNFTLHHSFSLAQAPATPEAFSKQQSRHWFVSDGNQEPEFEYRWSDNSFAAVGWNFRPDNHRATVVALGLSLGYDSPPLQDPVGGMMLPFNYPIFTNWEFCKIVGVFSGFPSHIMLPQDFELDSPVFNNYLSTHTTKSRSSTRRNVVNPNRHWSKGLGNNGK